MYVQNSYGSFILDMWETRCCSSMKLKVFDYNLKLKCAGFENKKKIKEKPTDHKYLTKGKKKRERAWNSDFKLTEEKRTGKNDQCKATVNHALNVLSLNCFNVV